jgi:hypothetical protein
MVRFSTSTIIIGISVIAWLDYATSSAITVEEQVRQLRESYVRILRLNDYL